RRPQGRREASRPVRGAAEMTAARAALIRTWLAAALLLPALPATKALAQQTGEAPPTPAQPAGAHTPEETAALQDLQSVLETLAADAAEDRRNREQAFRTLARVREALKSWAASVDFYRALIAKPSGREVAGDVLAGL